MKVRDLKGLILSKFGIPGRLWRMRKLRRTAMIGFVSIRQVVKQFLYAIPFFCALNVHAGTICTGTCSPDLLTGGAPSVGGAVLGDTVLVGGTLVGIPTGVVTPIGGITEGTLLPLPPVVQTGLFQLIPTQSAIGWQYKFSAPLGVYTNPSVTIPVFSDSLLTGISGPAGWSFSTGTTDIFGLGNGAGFMTWSYTGIADPNSYTWFSFQSAYGPATAPFLYADLNGHTINSSGVLVPLSPLAISAGLQPYVSPVPEPETWMLMSMGLIFGYFAKRRRTIVS
jgi:hypothetical protein